MHSNSMSSKPFILVLGHEKTEQSETKLTKPHDAQLQVRFSSILYVAWCVIFALLVTELENYIGFMNWLDESMYT